MATMPIAESDLVLEDEVLVAGEVLIAGEVLPVIGALRAVEVSVLEEAVVSDGVFAERLWQLTAIAMNVTSGTAVRAITGSARESNRCLMESAVPPN
jgi:hypothetical protein